MPEHTHLGTSQQPAIGDAVRRMHSIILGAAFMAMAASAQPMPAQASEASGAGSIERGRYLARISGCNDCHTPGYAESGGKLPDKDWLTGNQLGWRGPWGTTFPGNLRLFMSTITEDEWVSIARNAQYRPPMPWFALRDMIEDDLRAIYRFVRHLGAAGEAAPAYLPPDQVPKGPTVIFP